MNSKFFSLLILFCGLFLNTHAAEMLLTGVYHGTNVFVINPKDAKGEFCVSEIYVNNKKIDIVVSGYMEINLSHLKLKEAVNIKILHKDDCSPTIKNIHAIKAKESFQFLNINLTATSLTWETKGEKKFGQFFVESQKNRTWVAEKTFNGKAKVVDNTYEYAIANPENITAYRIKYLEASGKAIYSEEIVVEKK
jgi:hypothetical protein